MDYTRRLCRDKASSFGGLINNITLKIKDKEINEQLMELMYQGQMR